MLGAVAMGASPAFVRLADVGPFASAFWRTALALPFLWAWTRAEGPDTTAEGAWWDGPTLAAGLLFAGDLIFWHLAILGTTIGNATFLATTSPIWVALGAGAILGEAIGRREVLGLVLCVSGGAALIGDSYGFAPQRVLGDACGAVTAVFFGGYILAVRKARARHGAAAIMFLSTAVTAAVLFVLAIVAEPRLLPSSLQGASTLLALALIAQVAGQGLLAVALGTLPATFSSLVVFLEAIAAAAIGWVGFGEALGPIQGLGGLAILAGIVMARPRAADPSGDRR